MWKHLRKISVFILLGVSVSSGSPLKSKPTYDFSKGCDTYHSSLSLPEGYVADSQDVLFDNKAPVTKRFGYVSVVSTQTFAFQAEWTYTDPTNTSWIIVRSSSQISASNLSGSTVLIATVSANNLVGETNSQGDAFFVDQTQGVYYWNGTTTVYVSSSPLGSLITSFHGRIWVSGAAVPNGNQLYGSKYGDGTVWPIGLNPNDPVQLTIGLQDNFDNVTALYPFLDTLYSFKHYSTYALYGYDQTSFQIGFITSECGCIDQQSIQTFNHGLNFVSERGVEFFDGYTCTRISDAIKDKVDNAISSQGGFNSQSWIQSQTADWLAGTFNQSVSLSTSEAAPGLTTNNFSTSTIIPMSGLNYGIFLGLGQINNNSFESGTSSWTAGPNMQNVSTLTGSACTINPEDGSFFEISNINTFKSWTASLVLASNNSVILSSVTITPTFLGCGWSLYTLPSIGYVGQVVQINFSPGLLSYPFFLAEDVQFYSAGIKQSVSCSGGGSCGTPAFDFITNSPRATAASYNSPVFNLGYSNSLVQLQSAPNTIGNPSYSIKTSNTSTGPWTQILTSTGTNAVGSQFIRYTSTYPLTSSDIPLSIASSDTFLAAPSSGVFISQSHAVGSLNAFGNFAVQDTLNGGSIAFSVCSSSSATMVPSKCVVQSPNSQITVSTNSFVNFYSTFTVTAATQTPTLNSVTVQSFSGGRSPGMTSTVWDNRYWLALSTNTSDSFNDAILVLNKSGAWAPFNIAAGGLTQYKNNLYIADSKGTGNIYLYGNVYNDNGNPINAYIRSKEFSQDSLSSDDYYDSMYVSEDNLGNYNTTIEYFLDRDYANPFILSSLNQSEFLGNAAIKIPFIQMNQNFGKCISYQFSEADLNSPWNFYGWEAFYHPRNPQ